MDEEQTENSSLWMVTFSDLVMLLITFFVLLLSMSSMDKKKLEDLFTHFKEATGVLEFAGYKKISGLGSFIAEYRNSDSLVMIDQNRLIDVIVPSDELKKKLDEINTDIDDMITVNDDSRGIVLSLQEQLVFDPGEATLKRDIIPILDNIAAAIDNCPNDILIMGHTDNIPFRSGLYPSNWELSAHRGLSILTYFLKKKNLLPSRFAVGGYGPSRPLQPNDTPKNRASNRRVEIIFRHVEEA